jgi:hypothetical protein
MQGDLGERGAGRRQRQLHERRGPGLGRERHRAVGTGGGGRGARGQIGQDRVGFERRLRDRAREGRGGQDRRRLFRGQEERGRQSGGGRVGAGGDRRQRRQHGCDHGRIGGRIRLRRPGGRAGVGLREDGGRGGGPQGRRGIPEPRGEGIAILHDEADSQCDGEGSPGDGDLGDAGHRTASLSIAELETDWSPMLAQDGPGQGFVAARLRRGRGRSSAVDPGTKGRQEGRGPAP